MPSSTAITTINSKGESIFTDKIPSQLQENEFPYGSLGLFFVASGVPAELSNEADIDDTAGYLKTGLPNNRFTVTDGVAAAIVKYKPNADSIYHRTRTLDIGVVVDGAVEVTLDSGESRILKKGDTLVQRAPMHKVRNVTPDDGWATMFFVALDAKPIQIGEKTLEEEWRVGG